MLLRTAIAEGVEYVDLEDDVAAAIPRFGKTKRIVSLHDFRKTPDNLEEIHRRLCRPRPRHRQDLPRWPTIRTTTCGCCELIAAAARCRRSACAWATSACRRGSWPASSARRSPTPRSITSGRLAPGQLSFQQMTEIYHYDQINAETEVYGVIADPIGHSLSPLIHNAAFRQLELNKVYVPFRVPREDLAQFIDDAPALGIKGLSVTIPHKEEVVKKLTEADGAVRGIGAANTVVFDGDEAARATTPTTAPRWTAWKRPSASAERGRAAAARARRPWCSAPAAWARPSSTG